MILTNESNRNKILIRADETEGEIFSYCLVFSDQPEDQSNTVCINTQNPENAPNESHYAASFLPKLKPYKL